MVCLGFLVVLVVGARAYSVSPYKWAVSPVVFYLNPVNADVSAAAAEAAVQSALATWSTQPGSAFRYQYGGRVNDTSTSNDGRNVVIFRNDSTGAIASTYSWWSGGSRVDSDVIIYDADWRFFTGASGCVDGVYVEDVATHELGHSLGLAHSAVLDATMYSTYTRCSTSMRTLASDDLAGLQLLYPGTGGSSSTINSDTFPGAQLASSLDGTTVPNATRIVDTTGAIWTIGPNLAILRNGVQAAGGWGSQMVWTSHTLYVLGTDNNWYQWTGSSWKFLGATFPGVP